MTVSRRRIFKMGTLTYTLLGGHLIVENSDAGAFHSVVFKYARLDSLRLERKGSAVTCLGVTVRRKSIRYCIQYHEQISYDA